MARYTKSILALDNFQRIFCCYFTAEIPISFCGDCFEIELIVKGDCKEVVNGHKISVTVEDAVLLTPTALNQQGYCRNKKNGKTAPVHCLLTQGST